MLLQPRNSDQWDTEREEFDHRPPGADNCLQNCSALVYRHDYTKCQSWRDEVESFMVFAGLFSAVLTAFIMESYKWLMVEPDDISADYLRQILAVLSHVDVGAVKTINRESPLPSDVMIRINGFWFSSLTLSLTSALVGIVSKQWLREFLHDTGHAPQTNLAVRQVKYEGLTEWYVGAIIASIPLLLQTALFLFLAGVIDLLWHLQRGVAILISILCSSTMLFFVITTLLPGIQYVRHHRGLRLHAIYQAPFKSPQSWLFMRGLVIVFNFFAWVYAYAMSLCRKDAKQHEHVAPYQTYATWTEFDLDWTSQRDFTATWNEAPVALARCLGFIELTFEHASLRDWIWNCLWELRTKAVNAQYVLRCFRRDMTDGLDLATPEDRLIDDVRSLLDPAGSTVTSESIMHALLTTGRGPQRAEARLEHIIRIFNTFELQPARQIPRRVDSLMRNTLKDLADTPTTSGLRMQLCYIARNLLHGDRTSDAEFCSRWLHLAHAIVDHLSLNDTRDTSDTSATEYSLDIGKEVVEWLDAQPVPSTNRDLAQYKSRVLWAAQISVILARRFLKLGPLDSVASWHPRFSEIHDLVQRVYAKALSTSQDIAPAWRMGRFSLDELTLIRAALEARLEIEKEANTRRKRKSSARRKSSQRTDSSGTSTALDCGQVRLVDEPQGLDDQHPRSARTPSPPLTPEHTVHWNAEKRSSKVAEPRRPSSERGRGLQGDRHSSSNIHASVGAQPVDTTVLHPGVAIGMDGEIINEPPSPSRERFKVE
ncbi:hypothetical protein EV714DRAFT_201775 [Schizophyllum commune]